MDKLLYVAMSGAKETMATQEANNYNLANANTTGFKASLSAFQITCRNGPGIRLARLCHRGHGRI